MFYRLQGTYVVYIIIKYFHISQITGETSEASEESEASEVTESNNEEIVETSPPTHSMISTLREQLNDAFYEDMLQSEPAMVNIKENSLFNT